MATYIHRIDLKAWGDSPGAIHERFEDFRTAVEKAIDRTVTVGAEVIEKDFGAGSVDGPDLPAADAWRGRTTLHPDVGPDIAPK